MRPIACVSSDGFHPGEALGFAGGKSYALAVAAAGFLVACIIGVIYLNVQAKRGKFERKTAEEVSGSVTLDTFQDEGEMPISQSIDRFSIQVALIALVYVFTFFVLWGDTPSVGNDVKLELLLSNLYLGVHPQVKFGQHLVPVFVRDPKI